MVGGLDRQDHGAHHRRRLHAGDESHPLQCEAPGLGKSSGGVGPSGLKREDERSIKKCVDCKTM